MRKNRRIRLIILLTVPCLISFLFIDRANAETAISDSLFLIGMTCLIAGLGGLVRKTGFFFFTRYSFARFFAIFAKTQRPKESAYASYAEYRKSIEKDDGHKAPLAIAAAALGVSAVLAFLR